MQQPIIAVTAIKVLPAAEGTRGRQLPGSTWYCTGICARNRAARSLTSSLRIDLTTGAGCSKVCDCAGTIENIDEVPAVFCLEGAEADAGHIASSRASVGPRANGAGAVARAV